MNAIKKYKDSVFTKLFGHDKRIILELYNAIFNTNYDENTKIEITTLEDVLFMERINDISFVIDGKLVVLIEHQSTINPNMPLRMLLYITRNYEKICESKSMYRTKLMEIPVPEFVVLYNGIEEMPENLELKLSDMFANCGKENNINLELIVKVFNINKGYNPEFVKRSEILGEYETFIDMVRQNEKSMPKEESIVIAVKDCVSRGILTDFLKKHSTEVINMLLKEWKLEEAQEVWLEEGREEGMQRRNEEIARNMKDMGIDVNIISKATGLFVDDILRL
jgi:predicted transposase/invertase (TIGR01784 family)